MTVLSDREIIKALELKSLVIEPRPQLNAYDTTAVNLRLHEEIYLPKDVSGISFHLKGKINTETLKAVYQPRTISDDGFSLKPNHLILGRTRETVNLPKGLAGRVEGRSSLARIGLVVHLTAPTIHAGFQGTIVLEMINLGARPILLFPDIPVCQLILETVKGEATAPESRFQDQRHATGGKG